MIGDLTPWKVYNSAAAEASSLIKGSKGYLRHLHIQVAAALATGTYFIQVFDAPLLSSVPDGAFPTGVSLLVTPRRVAHTQNTEDTVIVDLTEQSINFSSGCLVVLSTTQFTKTISSASLVVTGLFS